MERQREGVTEKAEKVTIWIVREGGHPGSCITLPRHVADIPGVDRALIDIMEIAQGRPVAGGKTIADAEWKGFHDSVTAVLAAEAERSA